MRTFQHFNIATFQRAALALLLFAASAAAQTGTTVTGTTKTSSEQTPAAAGLKVLKHLGAAAPSGTDVYGTVIAQACEIDSAGRCVRYRETTCGGVLYAGPRVGYIKGDGTWIDPDETAGIQSVPNGGCTPSGLATEFIISLQPSVAEPTRWPATLYKLVRTVPDQASVDFSTLTVPVVATAAASKQDQSRGDVLDSEGWTCVAPATVPTPAAGVVEIFCDSSDSNKLKRKNSDASVTVIEGGGGGSGTVTSVGLALPTEFTVTGSPVTVSGTLTGAWASQTQNKVLASPDGVSGVPSIRGLVAADIPSLDAAKITTGQFALARLPFGTANQLIKTNAGATAQEHATFSIGTAGTDFAVAFGVGTITLNLPSASASNRGALLSADWTTFNNKMGSTGSPANTYLAFFSGAGTVTGTANATLDASGNLTLLGGMKAPTFTCSGGLASCQWVLYDSTGLNSITHTVPSSLGSNGTYTWPLPAAGFLRSTGPGIISSAELSGDVTTSGSAIATLANIPSATPMAGSLLATNIGAPASPAAGKVSIFTDSTDLRLHDKNASGVIGTTVVADAGATNNFLTAISASGAISKAQPVLGNINGGTAPAASFDFEAAIVTRPYRRLAFASFPGTCTANREFIQRSDPAAAGQVVYVCNAAGTGWDLVGDGGAGGSVPSPGANGMVACTGTACSTSAARTITGTTGNVTVTNGDGVAGNPTLDLGSTAVQTDQANTYSTGAQDFSAATSLILKTGAGYAPTADGSVGYDTTQKATMAGGNGAVTGRVPRLLATLVCNATACVGTGSGLTTGTFTNNCISGGADANCTNAGTTETAFGFSYTIPANFLGPNNSIKVDLYAERTATATVPTFLLKMKVAGTIVYQGAASAPAAATVRGYGQSYKIQGVSALGASVALETGIGNVTADPFSANNTAQTVAGFDTTATNAITFTLQLGAATIGNFVRVRQVDIWGL